MNSKLRRACSDLPAHGATAQISNLLFYPSLQRDQPALIRRRRQQAARFQGCWANARAALAGSHILHPQARDKISQR